MLTTCSSLKQLSLASCAVTTAAVMRMYATSAQKKPTQPTHDTSATTAAASAEAAVRADGMQQQQQQQQSVKTSSAKPSNSNNIRLVDYVSRKDLEMQRKVVMDMVTKTEIKFYDPPYLARDAPFPAYPELNINLKGYDFTVLESYHNFIARLCRALDVDVKDIYAMPARTYKIKTYRPFSTNLEKEYSLKMYHRVVRVKNLKSTTAPLLFEAIQLNLPEGVQLSVGKPSAEEDNFRYVPDLELKELKEQFEELTRKPDSASTPASTSPQSSAASTTLVKPQK